MNKKALKKSILCVLGIVAYCVVLCLAVETKNPVFIVIAVAPIIIGGIIAAVSALYDYFDEL